MNSYVYFLQRKWLLWVLIGIWLITWPTYSQAAIIYVNSSAAGANNGSSWANAYTSLQSALTLAVSGDQIWVAKGVYKPVTQVDVDASGGSNVREATFNIPNGVKLYGGFAGGEAALTSRNWALNLTILSGDLDNNDLNGDSNYIAEDSTQLVGNNAYHVVYTANVGPQTLVDGFVITAGWAYIASPIDPFHVNLDGGGWYNHLLSPGFSSSPTIRNTIFQGNYAKSEGGALYTTAGPIGATVESLIENCKFIKNKTGNSGGAIAMGSFVKGTYTPHFSNCEFTANEAYRSGGALYLIGDSARFDSCTFKSNQVTVVIDNYETRPGSGGAVAMVATKAAFNSCLFKENKATGNPTGAFEGGGGGAIYVTTSEDQTKDLGESTPSFINCGFIYNTAAGNQAAWGGAALHKSDEGILKPSYVNCVFTGNTAQNDGGAVANYIRVMIVEGVFSPTLEPTFTNCTFYTNSAGNFGEDIFNDGYVYNLVERLTARIENSILYGNTANTSGALVYNMGPNISKVSTSLIQGSGGSGAGWNASFGTDEGGNIDVNPQFIQAADPDGADNILGTSDDGLRLNPASPAVNAGNKGVNRLVGINTDIAGYNRIQGSSVDMGAYEHLSLNMSKIKTYWLSDWKLPQKGCLSCPWAIKLTENALILNLQRVDKGSAVQFSWTSKAQLIIYEDYALVVGRIASQLSPSLEFDVFLKLTKKSDWEKWSAQQRTYSAHTEQSRRVAGQYHTQWTYWELSDESRLVGVGAVSGMLKLKHLPSSLVTGFQLGMGANAQDGDFGLSGDFTYEGEVEYRGSFRSMKGNASLNVDAQLCEELCEPLTKTLSDERNKKTSADEEPGLAIGKASYLVYPNPAKEQVNIEPKGPWDGKYIFNLYDPKGGLVQSQQASFGQGKQTFSVAKCTPGLYYLQVQSPDGLAQTFKIVIQ